MFLSRDFDFELWAYFAKDLRLPVTFVLAFETEAEAYLALMDIAEVELVEQRHCN